MSPPLPPVYRQVRQLTVLLGQAVMRSSRDHKYSVVAAWRQPAVVCWQRVHRAVYDAAG